MSRCRIVAWKRLGTSAAEKNIGPGVKGGTTLKLYVSAPSLLQAYPLIRLRTGSLLPNLIRKRHVGFCAVARLPVERVIFAAISGPGIENIHHRFEFFTQFWNRSLKHAF